MATNKWATPQYVFDRLSALFGPFDVDVAADEDSAKCDLYFDEDADGLSKPWLGRVWCNPPYDSIGPWVRKASESTTNERRCDAVTLLLPARTDQPWWQETVMKEACEVYFVKGRIAFVLPGKKNVSFEPSVVVRFRRGCLHTGPQFRTLEIPKQGRLV